MRQAATPLIVTIALTIAAVLAACSKGEAKPTTPSPVGKPAEKSDPPTAKDGAKDSKDGAPSFTAADFPGLDLSGLDPSQVDALSHLLDDKPSACGKGHSLRTSLKTDPSCKRSEYAGRYLVRLLKAGLLGSEAEEFYDKRFTSPELGDCEMKDAHIRGNPEAKVTLCEFSDFQCPHCKLMEPILQKLLEDYPDALRVVYKNYPISKLHPEAQDAAAAAVAAGNQDKFWQMHDKLFANQDHLTMADLLKYAAELKLDMKKWKLDWSSAQDRVEREHAEGEKLDITGTPTLYINGRKFSGPPRYEEVKDWVGEELSR